MERIVSLMKNYVMKFVSVFLSIILILTGCTYSESEKLEYKDFMDASKTGNTLAGYSYKMDSSDGQDSFAAKFMYEDICYSKNDMYVNFDYEFTSKAAAAYDLDNSAVLYSTEVFEKLYPASITKLLTALTAVRYGNPDDICIISEDNCGINTQGAQLCGFKQGDRISLKNLLYCLLIYSGNDAAVAIAETVSGSTDDFCRLMNKEAQTIGAIDTHFTNPHGLQDINHYTTAYDMYLVFNECLKNPTLTEIFNTKGTTVILEHTDGSVSELYMEPTNLYFHGEYSAPEGMEILGGKTGTTIAAGNCLIILSKASNGHRYITEIFGAESKEDLYKEMNILLNFCKQSSLGDND